MAETVLEKPLSDAGSFAEYKEMRKSTPQPVAKPAEDSPADGDDSASEPEDGKSVSTPEVEKKNSTQENKPKRDRSFDGRISELTGKLKAAEEGRAKLERELEALRAGPRSPEAPKHPETPRPEAAKPNESDDEPDFEKFMDAAINDKANTTYEKAQAVALKAYNKAIRESEAKKAEQARTQSEAKTAHDARLAKTREKHSDFDEVVAAALPQVQGVTNAGVEAAMAACDSADVVYHFATHLDEFRRIAAMTPAAAYRATVALDLKLSGETPAAPEKPKPAVSSAPKPPSPVGGATSHNPKSPAEARDFAEYKRLRKSA